MPELRANKNLRDEFQQLLLRCSPGDPIVVSRRTLRAALRRFVENEIDVGDLVVWANLIEAHDQVQYEPGFQKLIADVVFCIASPEINEPLNAEMCHRLMDGLRLARIN